MPRNLQFNVGAKDDASATFKQIARNAVSAMGDIEGGFDDGRSAGERFVDELNSSFGKVVGSMKDTADAAEALGRALGPELSSKVDLVGIATDLQKVGLTVDDVKASADGLADAYRRLDELSLADVSGETDKVEQSAKEAKDALEQMGKVDTSPAEAGLTRTREATDKIPDSARGANSALANMIGNSAQDVGAFTGVAGSAGVALGQMAEYAADAKLGGEGLGSSLKSMALVAGPIAALSLVVGTVTGVLGNASEKAEKAAARTKQFGDAMDGAADKGAALQETLQANSDLLTQFDAHAEGFGAGIVEGLAEVGAAVPGLGSILGDAGQGISDLIPILEKAGIEADDLSVAIANGGRVGDEWWKTLHNAAEAGQVTEDEYNKLSQAIEKYGIEAFNGQKVTEFFTGAQEAAAAAAKQLAAEQESSRAANQHFSDVQQSARDHIEGVNDALLKQVDALNDQVDKARSAADATIAVDDAQREFSEAVAESNTLNADATATSTDKEAATRAERDAMLDAADAAVAKSEADGEASGAALTATGRIDTFNASLLANAHYATPAAQAAIADYVLEANGIPPEKGTDIKAAIERGDFDTAALLLSQLSATRNAAIQAEVVGAAAAEKTLDNLAVDRYANIRPIVGQSRLSAIGGTVPQEGTWAGEYGMEFIKNVGGTDVVKTRAESANIARGGGGDTYNLNITAADARSAVFEFERWKWFRDAQPSRAR